MTLHEDFDKVLETITLNQEQLNETVQTLEQLRKQINILENRKTNLRKSLREAELQKGTLERKIKIEDEGRRVAAELQGAKDKYRDILATLHFPNEPFDHQFTGAAKLAVAKRGMCADKRGLGKTLTGILWRHFVGSRKTLYLAPSKLALQAHRMLEKWDGENGMSLVNLTGQGKHTRDTLFKIIEKATDVVVLLNYESWRRDKSVLTKLVNCNFDALITDEIHNAKESNKLVAQGLRALAPEIEYMLELTGTPILNRPTEVWAPLNLLYPEIFPNPNAFKRDFLWGEQWSYDGKEKLAKIIAPFFVARDRDDVGIQIPPPDIITYPLTLENHPEQERAYKLLVKRALVELKEQQFPMINILEKINRQRQMISWPPGMTLYNRDPETKELISTHRFTEVQESVLVDFGVDTIGELVEEGERVILFNNFTDTLHEIKRRLHCKTALYIGATPDWERNIIERDFDLETAPKHNPRYDVLLATYKTVGEGLNLNAARHAILLDREWNPGREDQAIGRIDRLNSTDRATVHIPEVENTIMEFIRDLIEFKRDIIGGFNAAAKLQQALIEKLESEL